MNAAVYTEYGDSSVLHFKEIDKPIPKKNEVLVRVVSSTVTAGTIWARKGAYPNSWLLTFFIRLLFGLFRPSKPILGFEFSGIVEEVGSQVQMFFKGDHVYGTTTGLNNGAYADYVCIPEKRNQGVLSLKPIGLSFEEAASLPIGGMTALQLLLKAKPTKGQEILIYGASGSVGTYAVQLAKYYGCIVTAVCSISNFEMVQSIGANHVMDYKMLLDVTCAKKFDIVFDAVGKLPAKTLKRKTLKPNGLYTSIRSITNEKNDYLAVLHRIIHEDKLVPIIDRIYPLKDIVQAHAYVDQGHKKGNVVVAVMNLHTTSAV